MGIVRWMPCHSPTKTSEIRSRHDGGAIFVDGDVVLKIGDAPGFGGCDSREAQSRSARTADMSCARFQLRNYQQLRNSDNRSELHLHRLAVGRGGLKELARGKPNMPASMFVGNDWIFVFRSRTTAL